MTASSRKAAWSALRMILGLGLAAWCLYKVVDGNVETAIAEVKVVSKPLLGLALLLYGCILGITIYRWRLLLAVQGFHWSVWDLVKLSMIGLFFNMVIPGGVGGDVIKMAYVRHHAGERTAEAVTTILLDRIFGLFGLFVIAIVSCAMSARFLMGSAPEIRFTTIGIGICAVGAVIATICVIFRQTLQRLPGVSHLIAFAGRVLPAAISGIILRIVTALDLYKNQHAAVFGAIGLSSLVHLLNGVILLCIGRAFSETTVGATIYVLTIQVANVFASIPILPGGLGARDLAIKIFLEAGGADPGKAAVIPLFFTFVMVAWMLCGGFFFMFGKVAKDPDLQADTDSQPAPADTQA